MEPDVIRMYSSSPPPMEDVIEEEEDEFGDFGTFSSVPNSISFTEMDTPTSFNQNQALTATSPPELLNARVAGLISSISVGDLPKVNGVMPGGHSLPDTGEVKKVHVNKLDMHECVSSSEVDDESCDTANHVTGTNCNGRDSRPLTNGFGVQESLSTQESVHCHLKGESDEDTDGIPAIKTDEDFADFAAFSDAVFTVGQMVNGSESPAGESRNSEEPDEIETCQEGTKEDTVRDTNSPSELAHLGEHTADDGYSGVNLNGEDEADEDFKDDVDLSPGRSDNDTETETETSFGRPLSTDALEELGDISTTGSAPSPHLHEDVATPAEHSQLAEDDEDFGDFGDAESFGNQGFADFDQSERHQEQSTGDPAEEATEDDDFGDFNSPKFHTGDTEEQTGFANFPGSNSFGNFNSAMSETEKDRGWSAFGDQETETWAAFSSEEFNPPVERTEDEVEEWHAGDCEESIRTDNQQVAPCGLEKVFQSSFPPSSVSTVEDQVVPLKSLLECGQEEGGWVRRDVWTQLQDIHEAFGLRYQWGGSYCNKTLLCCLGIDTRNILFTGQKKQPVIVPMYAASLGMLEPTKEPLKPVSAAEMIASIAQTPPAAPEKTSCPSDSAQEALPPVQFDWSSSGLTNPLDGVDPELFELTTAKLDPGGAGSRVADAFARLMSTMEKTSTSTRKPRKDENLSEEASKVIASLPDLTFMTAKVLMFPATLTPLDSATD